MKLINVIVADDRESEREEITLLLEECGYQAHFYNDFRAAYAALCEQVGNRLLVNFQLKSPRNHGEALLDRLAEADMPVPTVVMDCSDGDKAVARRCSEFHFVKHIVAPADQIVLHKKAIQRAFQSVDTSPVDKLRHKRMSPSGMGKRPKVFIIHGHDDVVKQRIINILHHFTLDPVVLKSEPILSETLIEGVEQHSDVDYSIALFTGDDEAREKGLPDKQARKLKPRARQNVVFETGYLCAYLGRKKILLLCDDNVEMPSDLDGIRKISLDQTDQEIMLRIKQTFDELGIIIQLKTF